ncbi:unnamed protein product, partial [Prorocentrum cordatum]
ADPIKRRRTGKQSVAPSVCSAAPSTLSIEKGPPKSRAFEFMVNRDKLAARVKEAIKAINGPKSPYKQMMAKATKLTPEQKAELESDPTDITKTHASVMDTLKRLDEHISKLKRPDYERARTDVVKVEAELEDLGEKVDSQMECMQLITNKASRETRKENMKKRYARTKVSGHLVAGKYPNTFAKIVSQALEKLEDADDEASLSEDIQKNPDHIIPGRICLWTSVDNSTRKMIAEISSDVEKTEKSLMDAISSLDNKSWAGCMGRVQLGHDQITEFVEHAVEDPSEKHLEIMSEKGGVPWLTFVRPYTWRAGPNQCPLPGMAAVFVAKTDSIVVQIVDASDVVKNGVALTDLKKFMDTAEGGKTYQKKSHVFKLRVGDVLFVPFGFIMMPIYCPPTATMEKASKSEAMTMVGKIWSMTLLNDKWVNTTVHKETWAAILKINMDHLQKSRTTNSLWGERFDFLKKFVDALS